MAVDKDWIRAMVRKSTDEMDQLADANWWESLGPVAELDWQDVNGTAIVQAIRQVAKAGGKITFFTKTSNGRFGLEIFYEKKPMFWDDGSAEEMDNRLGLVIERFRVINSKKG